MLEPQTLEFFKYNRYYSRIASALSCGIICSFTGVLSENAKKIPFQYTIIKLIFKSMKYHKNYFTNNSYASKVL